MTKTITTTTLEVELTSGEYLTIMSALKIVQKDYSEATALTIERIRTKLAEAALEADGRGATIGTLSKLFTPTPHSDMDRSWAISAAAPILDDGRVKLLRSEGTLARDWNEATISIEGSDVEWNVWIRRAACGSGCFCGAEFTLTDPTMDGCSRNVHLLDPLTGDCSNCGVTLPTIAELGGTE